jgi:hypothetical protein
MFTIIGNSVFGGFENRGGATSAYPALGGSTT